MTIRAAPALLRRTRELRLPAVDPWLALALMGVVALLVLGLLGPRLAPHEPISFVVEHGTDPRPYDPGVVYPFGSDVLGRDILSLVLAGAPATLSLVIAAGAARLLLGAAVAIGARLWRPVTLLSSSVAGLASAIPVTIVALVIVKILSASGDASIVLVIGALLVTGWAGPYGLVRTELDRLAVMPFTTGARALGVTRTRLILRHQLPHLVPVLALNLSQQVVAALVLVAELGVLGVSVGTTRRINIAESLTHVDMTQVNSSVIADVPEWGGLLANARTVESLWVTRWLIFVPGLAFAATAVVVALVAFALARRYTTRDIVSDLRSRWAVFVAVLLASVVTAGALTPGRYAAARHWADTVAAATVGGLSTPDAFRQAGLLPLAVDYAVTRHVARVSQTAGATVQVGDVQLQEPWPRPNETPLGSGMRSFVAEMSGGGTAQAPLVFVARGIDPSEYPAAPPARPYPGGPGLDLGSQLRGYADDYAGIDVKGKVAVLVRFVGIAGRERGTLNSVAGYTAGPDPDRSIAGAIERGAAAVIFIDPLLPYYRATIQRDVDLSRDPLGVAGVAQYALAEQLSPPAESSHVPVVVLDAARGKQLLAPLGIDITPLLGYDDFGSAAAHGRTLSRELGVTARVSVPVRYATEDTTSYVGVTGGPATEGQILIWAVRRPGAAHPSAAVLDQVAAALAGRSAPFIYVDFDPSVDPSANAKAVRDALGGRRIALVVALDRLDGGALKIVTPFGDLIPAFEQYAQAIGIPHTSGRTTPSVAVLGDSAPLLGVRTVLLQGDGNGAADLRPAAARLLGYLAGRVALGAEEVPR